MLNRMIDEIGKCMESECFVAAMALALTLPDICGKAEFPDKTPTKRYLDWYKEYVEPWERPSSPYGDDMPFPSAEMIYQLRNMLLHQGSVETDTGRINDERCKVDEFNLVITDEIDTGISRVSYGKELIPVSRGIEINIKRMCHVLCRRAKEYYSNNHSKFGFMRCNIKDEREKLHGAKDNVIKKVNNEFKPWQEKMQE